MVDWVSAGGAALTLLGNIGNYVGERKTEKSYKTYQDRQRKAAEENYRQQVRSLHNRYNEEKEATANELQTNLIQNMQAKATAQASAASSGVSGSTIENMFKDYDRAHAVSTYTAKRNLRLKGLQTEDNIAAARIEALNVINNLQQYQGSSWGSLFSLFGNAFNTYSSYQNQAAQTKWYKQQGIKI